VPAEVESEEVGRDPVTSGGTRLSVLLATAMFVLVVDTSLMNVSISAVAEHVALA
jgi:hypothetical protein